MKKVAATLVVLLILAASGAALFVYTGVYNVAATRQHTGITYWLLQTAMTRSVRTRAEDIVLVHDLSDPATVERGLYHYQRHCVQCHGGPGVPPEDFAKGMTPVPPSLVSTAREWTPAEIFWVAKHGIKMSGMPGWDFKLEDDEIWAIVAFVTRLPMLTPVAYKAMVQALGNDAREGPERDAGRAVAAAAEFGDPERGKVAARQYACIACHIIPGIVGPNVRVGPNLRGIGERKFIAGVLPNTPENMIRWIRDPAEVDPLTAMPDMGVAEPHARDIAAYLYSLD